MQTLHLYNVTNTLLNDNPDLAVQKQRLMNEQNAFKVLNQAFFHNNFDMVRHVLKYTKNMWKMYPDVLKMSITFAHSDLAILCLTELDEIEWLFLSKQASLTRSGFVRQRWFSILSEALKRFESMKMVLITLVPPDEIMLDFALHKVIGQHGNITQTNPEALCLFKSHSVVKNIME